MFCQKCGTQLPDGSQFCTTCGTPTAAQAAPQAAPQAVPQAPQGYQPPYQAPVATAPKEPSKVGIYFKQVWSYIVNFFAKDPTQTMLQASTEKTPIWYALTAGIWLLGFGVMMAMIQALGFIKIADGYSINKMLSAAHKFSSEIPGSLLGCVGFFRVLLFSVLIIGATYGVKSVGTWVCASKIAKVNISLPAVMNMMSVAELPMVACVVLATLLCFIWWPLGAIVLLAGAAVSAVMHYEAVKTSGIFGNKKVWMIAALSVIVNLLFVLFLYWAITFWLKGIAQTMGNGMDLDDILGGLF